MTRISKTKAVELIENAGGRFVTVTFIKKNQQERTINCIVKKNPMTRAGYIRVYSIPDKGYKSVDPRTITKLVKDKQIYNIKKS